MRQKFFLATLVAVVLVGCITPTPLGPSAEGRLRSPDVTLSPLPPVFGEPPMPAWDMVANGALVCMEGTPAAPRTPAAPEGAVDWRPVCHPDDQ